MHPRQERQHAGKVCQRGNGSGDRKVIEEDKTGIITQNKTSPDRLPADKMHPVSFDGAIEIRKPDNMTDEECTSAWASHGFGTLYKIFQCNGLVQLPPGLYAGIDSQQFPFYMTAWQPNKEDIEAINRGEPIYIKTLSQQLPPMSVFTLDENGEGNF